MKLLATMAGGLVLVVSTACGGGGQATVINVTLEEWSVAPSAEQVSAGNVKFEVRNGGTQQHQFVVIKNDLPPEMLAVANGSISVAQVNVIRSLEGFPAGETRDLTLELSPGKHVLVCNLPGHYQQGMAAAFLVEP